MLQHCCLWFLSLSLSLSRFSSDVPTYPYLPTTILQTIFRSVVLALKLPPTYSPLLCSVLSFLLYTDVFVSVSKPPFGKYSISLSLSFLEVTPKSVGLFPTHQPTTLRWFPRSNTLGEFHRDRGCITGRSL